MSEGERAGARINTPESVIVSTSASRLSGKPDGTLEVRVPAYPTECEYVRVVHNRGEGNVIEKAYWDSDEWQESPAEVMGAIMGAIKGVAGGGYIDLEKELA